MKVRFSIRYKILLVITGLLVACVGLYTLLATRIFTLDKSEFVYDLNRSLVTNISSDIRSVFSSVRDKLELFAVADASQSRFQRLFKQILSRDENIVYLRSTNRTVSSESSEYINSEFLETYNLSSEDISKKIEKIRPIPFEQIQKSGEAVWNATIPNGPILVGYGRSVVKENQNGIPVSYHAVISYLRLDSIIRAIGQLQLNEVVVVNQSGQVLLHKDPAVIQNLMLPEKWELFKKAKSSSSSVSVLRYQAIDGEMLGAFASPLQQRVYILARIPESRAFAVVDQLVSRSILFSGIILSLAFIIAILTSRSLTRPIQVLVQGMQSVARGDLESKIHLRSSDETGLLALSFNQMIGDLKESRDQLEEINRQLEDKVKERTIQLERQNQAVKEAQENLLKTSRLAAVGEIAGRAAHEILNPLTGIMTRLQLVGTRINNQMQEERNLLNEIQQGWESDYQKGGFERLLASWKQQSSVSEDKSLWEEDLENIKQIDGNLQGEFDELNSDVKFLLSESQRIGKIVESMRSLSTVKNYKTTHHLSPLLQDSCEIMRDLYDKSNVDLRIEEGPESSQQVSVDRDEFLQCMTNLLRNALQSVNEKHKEQPGGEVVLKLSVNEDTAVIDISDNGMGIKDENKDKLFRAQFTTKSHDDGTGLGLSISRRFIRAFGGDVTLNDSTFGQGAVFRITLPLVADEIREAQA